MSIYYSIRQRENEKTHVLFPLTQTVGQLIINVCRRADIDVNDRDFRCCFPRCCTFAVPLIVSTSEQLLRNGNMRQYFRS